jgi:hypothetical protein
MTTDPPKPRRRFFRYSLRTLMLVAAVFCIWLGIITNRARDRKQAIELFRTLGGSVRYEHERPPSDPPGPEWLRQLIGDEYFFSVHTLSLNRSKVDDSSLASVKRFPELKGLNLFRCKVTEAGLVHLKGMTKLEILILDNTQVTDAGLEHLRGLTELRSLFLNNTQVTDAGLVHLKGMIHLDSLWHYNTEVTDAGLKKLHPQRRRRIR